MNNQSQKSDREPLEPLVLPQREPRLQPAPVRTVFHDESLGHSPTIPVLDTSDGADFELMEVAITVYGLSGIICRTADPKKSAKMFSKKGGTEISKASSRPGVHSLDLDESGNPALTNPKGDNLENDSVPTTAVVSFRRNAFSSDTALETFMPSLPLTKPLSGFGNTARYMASWPAGERSALLGKDPQGISTINMIRVMRREKYRPETKIGQVSGYVHETIDLGVCIGRGKELVHLGTVSFAITGDEEGEVVTNVPVKSLTPHATAKRKSSKKKRSKISSFPHDSSRSYLLDDNATLRVGVRVLPQHTIKTAEDNADQQKIKKERSLEDILKSLLDENLILELNDEYALIDGLVANQNKKLEKGQNNVETPQGIFPGFFCGALMCSAPASSTKPVGVPKKEVDKTDAAAASKKISEAVILPLTLMSSVSESTDGTRENRNYQLHRLLEL
jgi:hypothetical protein